MSPIAFVTRTASPIASAWFRYLAIIFGLSRYSAASKKRALGICLSPRSYFPFTFSARSTERLVNVSSDSSRDEKRVGGGAPREPLCWHQQCPRTAHTGTNYSQRAHPKRD